MRGNPARAVRLGLSRYVSCRHGGLCEIRSTMEGAEKTVIDRRTCSGSYLVVSQWRGPRIVRDTAVVQELGSGLAIHHFAARGGLACQFVVRRS